MRSASGPVLCRKSILSISDSTLHGAKTAGLHWGYFLNGGFRSDVASTRLRELFEPFGTVSEVKVITDRETGQSRGFGFVTMGNVSEGNAAIQGLDGKDKGGRKLKVNEARPKDDRGGRPSPGSRR